ncbi:hypothetical protein BDP27DRAFT_785832 [Rhodocollybia butyracea]|uniref:Uncharacterized protein n=1 Tax=Rhodocollybia butyracea TaxID=206335 RepID=A0A9P5PRA8_9AGAR|nr:hypothetical protein BDP27DRAFT_785832 [Rhodocollybia butyracea]
MAGWHRYDLVRFVSGRQLAARDMATLYRFIDIFNAFYNLIRRTLSQNQSIVALRNLVGSVLNSLTQCTIYTPPWPLLHQIATNNPTLLSSPNTARRYLTVARTSSTFCPSLANAAQLSQQLSYLHQARHFSFRTISSYNTEAKNSYTFYLFARDKPL